MKQLAFNSWEGKLILTATIIASGMAFLDGTVVNIAVPVIQKDLQTTIAGIQWIINSYALLMAAFILISGSLGDRFGRKRIFSYGIGIFVLCSLLCSLARDINQLILFRSLQGLGAAMMIPGSLSIINTTFEEKVRGKVIGLWSGFAGGIASLGPFLGGWLVQTFGWQSIFYLNIPLGLIALFITLRYIPESKNDDVKSLDIGGTFLLFLGLLGISYALIEAPVLGFTNSLVVGAFFLSILALVSFIFQEKKAKEPLVPFRIFNSPLVIGANLVTLSLYFALTSIIFFFILNLQQLQHYSPLIAGLGMLPSILIITFLSGYGGSLSDKIGPRIPMILGPLLVSFGMASLLFAGVKANYFISFLPGLVLSGLGMSLVIAPLTKSALAVDSRYSGAASGVNNATSRIAALLAIALLGAIMAFTFSSQLTKLVSTSHLSSTQQHSIIQQKDKIGAVQIPNTFLPQEKQIAQHAVENAFLFAFRVVIGISAALAFLSAVLSFFFIKPKPKAHLTATQT
ncbi:MAG: MFS transporter [Candidatus Levyibacteriota bacterium]